MTQRECETRTQACVCCLVAFTTLTLSTPLCCLRYTLPHPLFTTLQYRRESSLPSINKLSNYTSQHHLLPIFHHAAPGLGRHGGDKCLDASRGGDCADEVVAGGHIEHCAAAFPLHPGVFAMVAQRRHDRLRYAQRPARLVEDPLCAPLVALALALALSTPFVSLSGRRHGSSSPGRSSPGSCSSSSSSTAAPAARAAPVRVFDAQDGDDAAPDSLDLEEAMAGWGAHRCVFKCGYLSRGFLPPSLSSLSLSRSCASSCVLS